MYAVTPPQTKVRVDNKEIDGHVWVLPEEITRYVQRKEYLDFVTKLLEEGISLAKAKLKPLSIHCSRGSDTPATRSGSRTRATNDIRLW